MGVADNIDQAYVFLSNNVPAQAATSDINLAALRRKIDWHIVPIMFLVYTMNLIDKVAYNVRIYPFATIGKDQLLTAYSMLP